MFVAMGTSDWVSIGIAAYLAATALFVEWRSNWRRESEEREQRRREFREERERAEAEAPAWMCLGGIAALYEDEETPSRR